MEKTERSSSMPERYIGIGEYFLVAGVRYRVVPNRAVMPFEACSGCAFSGQVGGRFRSCPNVQCSSFDRCDGRSVWFVEDVDGE